MLPQRVVINISVDSFAIANENDGTFLAVAAHHSQNHLHQRSLRFGQDADAGIHVSHREVHQVAVVLAFESMSPVKIFSLE
jgi:hypothetical protein